MTTLKGLARETIPELLACATREHGSRVALKLRGDLRLEKYSYSELDARVAQMTQLLMARGIVKGDRVLLWAANSPAWVIVYFGILQLGAVAVPLDVRSTAEFAHKIVAQTGAKLAIIGEARLSAIKADLNYLLIEDLRSQLDRVTFNVGAGDDTPCRDDLAEIMFTSGTTSSPKGVMLTHGNLVANVRMALALMPIRKGFRVLSVLPLSHMFEQVVGLLVPLASGAQIVYIPSRQPNLIVEALQREQIEGMALVPQALSLLMKRIEGEVQARGLARVWRGFHRIAPHLPMWLRRVLSYPVRRSLDASLQFVLSGGALLPIETARKWDNLGIPVLEGYGATEATALVTGNRLNARRVGTIGKPAPGIDLRVADDGEILIRGENIFKSYWQNPAATQEALRDGWYHTGDMGELDQAGFVHFRGRKKNLIVLGDGMKVHPEDLEEILRAREGIRDAVVLGWPKGERTEIHAVLLATDAQAAARAIRDANAQLAPHQQIQGFTVWPGEDFPRTPTLKVKRHEVLEQLTQAGARSAEIRHAPPVVAARDVSGLVAQVAGVARDSVSPDLQLGADVGLDSLSLVELLTLIEEQKGVRLDDQQLSAQTTVSELERLVERGGERRSAPSRFSSWPLQPLAVNVREILQTVVLNPLLALFAPLQVSGSERLHDRLGPCLIIGNHTSHLDSLLVLRALPRKLRRRVAVAAAADYWFRNPLLGFFASLAFNAYPLVRSGAVRGSLEHTVDLIDRGWSVLIFPEGTRSRDGKMQSFRTGIGLLATETEIPVMPLYIAGSYDILPKASSLPHRGKVVVTIGQPVCFRTGADPIQVTRELEKRVKSLSR